VRLALFAQSRDGRADLVEFGVQRLLAACKRLRTLREHTLELVRSRGRHATSSIAENGAR
jgi:hypothetical protein